MSMCCTIDRFKSYLDDESNELSNMKEAISYLSVYLFAKDDNELFEKVIKKHDDLKEKIAWAKFCSLFNVLSNSAKVTYDEIRSNDIYNVNDLIEYMKSKNSMLNVYSPLDEYSDIIPSTFIKNFHTILEVSGHFLSMNPVIEHMQFASDKWIIDNLTPYSISTRLKNHYSGSLHGKKFLSIDLKKGNATVLFILLPKLFGMDVELTEKHPWTIFIETITDNPFFRRSKEIRQNIIGSLHKKMSDVRIQTMIVKGMKTLIGSILEALLKSKIIPKKNVINYQNDEIVIQIDETIDEKELIDSLKILPDFLPPIMSDWLMNFITVEIYKLVKFDNPSFFVKEFSYPADKTHTFKHVKPKQQKSAYEKYKSYIS